MLGWDILHLLRCNIFRYVHSIYQKRLLVKSVYKLRCTDYLSKKNTITTSTPFQLIHLDLWGPYKIANICGAHYFLTIVDDFTRTTWTQLLQNKTQVGLAIKHFFSMINNQFKAKIVMVRSDNDTEFLNSSCLDFFSENSIIHQKSIPGTPQQNGVAERKHRHLLDSARAIRLHAGLPKHFWGECILAATHIINKLPMANLNWTTPFERLHGKPPTYDDLRVIGCLSFAANLKPTDKFDTRAKRCILVGYSLGHKGYKLYDLNTKKTFHSRDVLFHETVFPFKGDPTHIGNTNQTPDLLSPYSFFPSHITSSYLDYTPPASDTIHSSFPEHEPIGSSSSPSSQSPNKHDVSQNLNVPDSLNSSTFSPTHNDHLHASDIAVHSPSAYNSLVLRRSSRSRCPPAWL